MSFLLKKDFWVWFMKTQLKEPLTIWNVIIFVVFSVVGYFMPALQLLVFALLMILVFAFFSLMGLCWDTHLYRQKKEAILRKMVDRAERISELESKHSNKARELEIVRQREFNREYGRSHYDT